MNLFGGSSTKQRPDSEPRSLGDHGSVFRFLGSQLEGKILRGPMCIIRLFFGRFSANSTQLELPVFEFTRIMVSKGT